MTEAQKTLLMVKGAISDLPEADRDKVTAAYEQIWQVIQENLETPLALCLILAELAVKDE